MATGQADPPKRVRFILPDVAPSRRGDVLIFRVYDVDATKRVQVESDSLKDQFMSIESKSRDVAADIKALLEVKGREVCQAVHVVPHVRAEIPFVEGPIVTVDYKESTEATYVPTERSFGAIITHVPTAQGELHFTRKRGATIGFSAGTLVNAALPVFAKVLVPSTKLTAAVNSLLEMTCAAQATELPEATVAATGSRAKVLAGIDSHHVTDIGVCDGDDCPMAKDDEPKVRSRLHLQPSPAGRWTLLADASIGVGLFAAGTAAGSKAFGLSGQSPPSFEPVLGAAGPEQVFELRQRINPRNAVTTSLLLGRHMGDLWFVGAGPSLTVGASGSALSQISVRVCREVFADSGVFLTGGIGMRFVDAPDFYAIGDHVAVAQPAGMTANAPKLATHTALLFQLEIGLAIDLGKAASGASTIISSFGGPK